MKQKFEIESGELLGIVAQHLASAGKIPVSTNKGSVSISIDNENKTWTANFSYWTEEPETEKSKSYQIGDWRKD